jgi:hypothetical protein
MAFKVKLILSTLFITVLLKSLSGGGLLWSDNDLAEWQTRSVSGPYKDVGDAFDPSIPAEWGRIVAAKNAFMASPSAERKSSYTIWLSGNGSPIQNHKDLSDAAFYALVKSDSTVADAVKSELLWHARQSGLQISRNQYQKTDAGNWWNAAWVVRLLVAGAFIEDSFTASELTEFQDWMLDYAYSFESSVHTELLPGFGNRAMRDYVNNLGWAVTTPQYDGQHAYKNGQGQLIHPIANIAKYYNNRRAGIMQLVGLAAVWGNDSFLIDRTKLFWEEWLKFSVFPDGAVGEFERNNVAGNVQRGFNYNAYNLESLLTVVDAMARVGDTWLYDYSTTDGIYGTECTIEPAKSFKMVVETYLDLIEHKRDWYCDEGEVIPEHLIDHTSETGAEIGKQWVGEIYFAPVANRYWKDSRITAGYTRSNPTSIQYGSNFGSAGPYGGPWRGFQSTWPSVLFMFSEMESITESYPTDIDGPTPGPEPSYPTGYREAIVGGLLRFGLDPTWGTGQEFEAVFDGDSSTFYDYRNADGGFVGVDFGESRLITSINYQPRSGWASRMIGGRFEGSNESTVSGYEVIYVVTQEPSASLQSITIDAGKSYRYCRYLSPLGGFANIAEFSIDYNTDIEGPPPAPEPIYPDGYREAMVGGLLRFGLDPTWGTGQEFEAVFDGDPSTFYDYRNADGGFVGIDFGESCLIASINYQPRSGWASRMVGGRFEGSNQSTVSGYEVIYYIAQEPSEAEQRVAISPEKSYRYYRYLSPLGGFANIAEFSMDVKVIVTDDDKLPDDWEIQYFGGLDVVNGGEAEDFDGDGVSNYDEWVAGTDPSNATDLLWLRPAVGVSWNSVSGRIYQIEYSDDNWKTFMSSEPLVATGEQMNWIDQSAGNIMHKRQYRILILDP